MDPGIRGRLKSDSPVIWSRCRGKVHDHSGSGAPDPGELGGTRTGLRDRDDHRRRLRIAGPAHARRTTGRRLPDRPPGRHPPTGPGSARDGFRKTFNQELRDSLQALTTIAEKTPREPQSTHRRRRDHRGLAGLAGFLGSRGVHLSEVSQSGSLSYLPPESESVAVLNLSKSFGPEQDTLPAVVVFERTSGLTDGDKKPWPTPPPRSTGRSAPR